MGMAASQARLLCITARIHDVEYQAQSIQNAKVQLATQSDQVYQEYLEALDAQTMVLKSIDMNGNQTTVPATFNNLCSKNKLSPASTNTNYALKDARGRLIVDDEIASGFAEYKNSGGNKSPEAFAFFMIYNNEAIGNISGPQNSDEFNNAINNAEEDVWNSIKDSSASNSLLNIRSQLEELTQNSNIYDTTLVKDEDKEKYNDLLASYREQLYKQNGYSITNKVLDNALEPTISEEEYEQSSQLFNYYVNIYNQIIANGGACIAISKFDGFNGDAANDPEWLTTMVQCGQISIELVQKQKDGSILFNTTSPSSDTCVSFVETSSIDKNALKKAEAKYEHDLNEIQKKDKNHDLTLSKLEAERTALTTEYDSVKKVIEDNIERTFGIFS